MLIGTSQAFRVAVALTSVLALCTLNGTQTAVIPLYLGVIAAALTETEDTWLGRMESQAVTLAFFAAAAFTVNALIDRPGRFVVAIAGGTFCLTLMGSLQARYRPVGFATLALAMYATIGADGHATGSLARAQEPWQLLAGAAWYGALSIVSAAVWPVHPVQRQVARVFEVLGDYLRYKASLFEPVRGLDIPRKRLVLAQMNVEVVTALNEAKAGLVLRLQPHEPAGHLARFRGLYLIAQDVHERAGSSHDDYNALAEVFFHSDLLYRCQQVLLLQGDACTRLASSVSHGQPFAMDGISAQALAALHSAIRYQRARSDSARQTSLLASMDSLAENLTELDAQLAGASEPLALVGRTDLDLSDAAPRSLRDMTARVRRELVPGSPLLRHALRLAVALGVGFGLAHFIHPAQGYWIMLTTLFVCQRNYGETVTRLIQRTAGTVVGVVMGWALLQLFPQAPVQSMLAVLAGVLFFATRVRRYLAATAAITVLVLLCSNQVGHGVVLIVPRLIDTALGSLIAWMAVLLVFPHWQARHFGELATNSLRCLADYLLEVARQYQGGARDDLGYRVARRNAHDADAALSTALIDMSREPGRTRPHGALALRFLLESHTLLNYISALGAHRVALPDSPATSDLVAESKSIAKALHELATELSARSRADDLRPATQAVGEVDSADVARSSGFVASELALVRRQVASLGRLVHGWPRPEQLASRAAFPRG